LKNSLLLPDGDFMIYDSYAFYQQKFYLCMTSPSSKKIQLFTAFVILSVIFFSCSSTKKIRYFQDIPDSGRLVTIPPVAYTGITVQPGDVMNVAIQTVDPSATKTINSANLSPGGTSSMPSGGVSASSLISMASGGGAAPEMSGYLVDKKGYLIIPMIGQMKAAGLTAEELRDTIYNRAKEYYKEPAVTVNFANFKVNVLGEVLKPGQYVLPYDNATIFDALAMAGDLTVFGKRENVLLVRTNPDRSKILYRINLKKSDIMSQPYFYLRQNDLIYIEPRKAKSDATDASQAKYITLAGALLSIILVLAYRSK
jgi:polysaccharide export outer membrane protein